MSSTDNNWLKGFVTVTLSDARTGDILSQEVRNLVTSVGTKWVADRMLAHAEWTGNLTAGEDMSWIELGLSGAAPANANTNLLETYGPKSEVRQTWVGDGTNNRVGSTWVLICNWATAEANTQGIEEAGIFSTGHLSVVGLMLARTTFTAVNKTNSDTLKIQWQINVADDGA